MLVTCKVMTGVTVPESGGGNEIMDEIGDFDFLFCPRVDEIVSLSVDKRVGGGARPFRVVAITHFARTRGEPARVTLLLRHAAGLAPEKVA